MNKEQLKEEITLLTRKFEQDKVEILKKYCNTNNPYKVGDIFTDHMGAIKIESIGYLLSNDYERSCCKYNGIAINKNGTLKKVNPKRTGFLVNDKYKS